MHSKKNRLDALLHNAAIHRGLRVLRRAHLGRIAGVLFAALLAWLLASSIRSIDWSAVSRALAAFDARTLAVAACLAGLGYAAAASYDLLGRRYAGTHTSPATTLTISFIAYAFSLNLGALVGGWASRIRLYTRYHVSVRQVARIIVFAVTTNWSGFVLLGGIVLAVRPPEFSHWPLGPAWTRAVGAVLVLTAIGYLWLCAVARRRQWRLHVRGVVLDSPGASTAVVQLALSCASWALIAATLAYLLPDALTFPRTLTILLVASVMGAAMHIPGNLGVLEASVIVLGGTDLERATVIAGLLAFRAVYYLAPLAIAGLAYAAIEVRCRRVARAGDAGRVASLADAAERR